MFSFKQILFLLHENLRNEGVSEQGFSYRKDRQIQSKVERGIETDRETNRGETDRVETDRGETDRGETDIETAHIVSVSADYTL